MNQYETVFILTPVLSDEQMKEAVKKYEDFLTRPWCRNGTSRELGHAKTCLSNPEKINWLLPVIGIQS